MTLDRSKKYEGLGLVWGWSDILLSWTGWNESSRAEAQPTVFQGWFDAGHIQPVRETKIVRVDNVQVQVTSTRNGGIETRDLVVIGGYCLDALPRLATSKPVTLEFEVEA